MLSLNFASDLDLADAQRRGSGGAHKKEGLPCPKGGLKSTGPCQNHMLGATPWSTQTVDFCSYLRWHASFPP
jgi:hypothetical protein